MAQLKSTVVTGDLSVTGGLSASTIIKINGTNSQVLVADGSVKTMSASNGSGNANTIVVRDSNGNLVATSANKVANQLTINNKTYDGSAPIDVGTMGVPYGGTGLTAAPSLQVNLGSTSAVSIFTASPRPGITGTLGVGNGGTGLTAAPSLQVNLGSTSATSIFTASPRPGVTGVLGVANGGTGTGTHTTNRVVWYNGSTLTAGYHYADQTHIGVGYTASTAPSYTLYVGDHNSSAGTFGVKKSITIADEVTMQYDSTLKAMKFVF